MVSIFVDLFLGDKEDAADKTLLMEHGITHVVNCAARIPCYFPEHFQYLALHMEDPYEGFPSLIPTFCAFIDKARLHGKVLVHCRHGLSRSASVILAYLGHLGYRFDQALDRVLSCAAIRPHSYFLTELQARCRPSINPKRARKLVRRIVKY